MLNPFIVELARNALPETVRYVVEALVIVPLVDQRLVAVKLVEEAFNVYVVVAMVRFPAKYPLPFTERSCPGVVVPMPTRPDDKRVRVELPFVSSVILLPRKLTSLHADESLLYDWKTATPEPPLADR